MTGGRANGSTCSGDRSPETGGAVSDASVGCQSGGGFTGGGAGGWDAVGRDFPPQAKRNPRKSQAAFLLEEIIGLLINPKDQDELELLIGIVVGQRQEIGGAQRSHGGVVETRGTGRHQHFQLGNVTVS